MKYKEKLKKIIIFLFKSIQNLYEKIIINLIHGYKINK